MTAALASGSPVQDMEMYLQQSNVWLYDIRRGHCAPLSRLLSNATGGMIPNRGYEVAMNAMRQTLETKRRSIAQLARSLLASAARAHHFRVWYGIGFGSWIDLLARHGLRLSPWQAPRALLFSALSLFNSCVGLVSRLVFARRIRRIGLDPAPVLVLGHWRTGTTYLHELLSCDERFISPKGYQCGAPLIFFVCETSFRPVLKFFMPNRRPMDNMVFNLERPQEDEYALLGLLGRSIYRSFIFPSAGPLDRDYLSLRSLAPSQREHWVDTWIYFLRSVAARYPAGKRLLLKTPQHTARVATILSAFPEARFVHLARNPLSVYASTVATWRALCDTQGLEGRGWSDRWLEESVLSNLEEMYDCYEEDRRLIPAGHLIEIRYEDLVADPTGVVRSIYGALGLSHFANIEPDLRARIAESRDYRTNVHRLTREEIETVSRRWRRYIERFGYGGDVAGALGTAD